MFQVIDLTGQVFNRLTVLRRGPNKGRQTQWVCQCTCGTIKTILRSNLYTALSCGCALKEMLRARNLTHGLSRTPEYRIWCDMKRRCYDTGKRSYPDYGGRGIVVCDRWRDDFAAFLADMGPRPSTEHMLERRNNDGPYSPDNTYWSTRDVQNRNKRNNRWITLDGRTECLADWSKILAIPLTTFYARVRLGWSDERALSTPIRPIMSGPRPSKSVSDPEQGILL